MTNIDLTYCNRAGEHIDNVNHTAEQCPHPEPKCLDRHSVDGQPEGADCTGKTEYRESLSGTGTPIARCDGHWSKRLDEQERINRTYPQHAPADFDPYYAGEAWGEDDY